MSGAVSDHGDAFEECVKAVVRCKVGPPWCYDPPFALRNRLFTVAACWLVFGVCWLHVLPRPLASSTSFYSFGPA